MIAARRAAATYCPHELFGTQATHHAVRRPGFEIRRCAAEQAFRRRLPIRSHERHFLAANYRAALRAKSRADFVNKITIVLEEADETEFWIELTEQAGLVSASRLAELREEAN